MRSGLLYLKGGELADELRPLRYSIRVTELRDVFTEEFFLPPRKWWRWRCEIFRPSPGLDLRAVGTRRGHCFSCGSPTFGNKSSSFSWRDRVYARSHAIKPVAPSKAALPKGSFSMA
jgi:hypothetical protein